MAHGRFDNPVVAALAGVKDFFRKQDLAGAYTDDVRLDGLTCLVTGANSGLGYGVAVEMASRGARVIMAGRSDIPGAGERVQSESGSDNVKMYYLDLASITAIVEFVTALKRDGVILDRVVLNAGVALPKARELENGQEEMFFVNYLSNCILVDQLLEHKIIGSQAKESPDRLLFVSSDSHQGSSEIDYDEFGKFVPYGVSKGISYYSYYKLVMNTYATELSRRVSPQKLKVHVMCPGPVNSKIAKEGPPWLQGVLGVIFFIFFKNPRAAARPVVYMMASDEYGLCTNEYLHMFNKKRMDEKVYSPEAGAKLWQATRTLIQSLDSSLWQNEPDSSEINTISKDII